VCTLNVPEVFSQLLRVYTLKGQEKNSWLLRVYILNSREGLSTISGREEYSWPLWDLLG
jgi:hypothetical protein